MKPVSADMHQRPGRGKLPSIAGSAHGLIQDAEGQRRRDRRREDPPHTS
jgi:hypothetical protein